MSNQISKAEIRWENLQIAAKLVVARAGKSNLNATELESRIQNEYRKLKTANPGKVNTFTGIVNLVKPHGKSDVFIQKLVKSLIECEPGKETEAIDNFDWKSIAKSSNPKDKNKEKRKGIKNRPMKQDIKHQNIMLPKDNFADSYFDSKSQGKDKKNKISLSAGSTTSGFKSFAKKRSKKQELMPQVRNDVFEVLL